MVGNDGNGIGLNGLWYGMFSGQFVLVALYEYFIIKKVDWAECSREAIEKIEKDAKLIQKEPTEESNAIAVQMEDLKDKKTANGP
jgi:hypothetical protein